MAHRYGDVVLIRRAEQGKAADRSGAPAAFVWRGVWYQVDETLATWRLRDRWWAAPAADVADVAGWGAPHADALPPTDRVYYRVRCVDPAGEQIFDLYYDVATCQWVLDRAHD